jgi:ADP-heptose:LPS heptosyltransferase
VSRILVIKHGALGDIVLAFPAFAAIRAAHPDAQITLLTTAPYAGFLALSNWFDAIEIDARPGLGNPLGLLKLRRQLRGFAMVYDLQTSARSSRYFALAGRPPFSGIATGCAYRHVNPERNAMHTRERLAEQLSAAGIAPLPPPDLSWLAASVEKFDLPAEFALLVPGAAPHRPEKRWPAEKFAALAKNLALPVVIAGGAGESAAVAAIKAASPAAIDLTGRTSLAELAAVAARSTMAIGNDTGPMHLAAALAIPCVVLFGGASDPALTAPRYPDGGWPSIVRAADLAAVPVAQVLAALP